MAENISDIAAGLSQATQGSDKPNQMTISRPTKEALWAVFAAMAIIAIIDMGSTALLSFRLNSDKTAVDIVHWLGWGILIGRVSEAVVVFALVSSRIARVEATVGAAHIDLTGTA